MKKTTILLVIFTSFTVAEIMSCDDSGTAVTTTNLWIRLSDATGEDAYITDRYPDLPLPSDRDLSGIAFIDSLGPYRGRTLFKFYLSAIPSTANVTNATLLLTPSQNPEHYFPSGHRTDGGSNACTISRILEAWTDSTATWNNANMILTTGTAAVNLDSSTSSLEPYTLDVTALVKYSVQYPNTNFGYLLKLNSESPVRVMGFASGNYPDTAYRPLLQVTYTSQP